LAVRPLGTVLHITRSKYVIVKIHEKKFLPPIGSEVVDANNELMGKVVDVIGPVDSPYAVVKPLRLSMISFIKPSMLLFYRIRKLGRGKKH